MLDRYLAGSDPERAWFARWGIDEAAVLAAAPEILAQGDWDRQALADIARRAVEHRGGGAPALAAADRLADPGTVCVVAGQQPGHGFGPFFNLVKIAHCLLVARRLTAAGLPTVAVYWSAAEDHDQGEADHCDLIGRDGRIDRLRLPFTRPGASLSRQPIGSAAAALLERLADRHPTGLGVDWLREALPAPATSLADWCATSLQRLWGDHGLVVLQAQELRPLWRHRWPDLVAQWPAAALAAHAATLPRLPLGELAEPPVFHDRPDAREALTPAGIERLAASDPDALSPGAGLRPIWQQQALPCVGYCAGPGELAYHAQLKPLYATFGLPAPVLLPRLHATWLPGWWRRGAAAWDLSAAAFSDSQPPRVPATDGPDLGDLAEAIASLPERGEDEDTRCRLLSGRRELQRALERLQASLARGDRQRRQRPALGALHGWIRPRGLPQERVLSAAQVIAALGPGVTGWLLAGLADQASGGHGWLES